MTQKVDQWMQDAAYKIYWSAPKSSVSWCEINDIAEIIASHASSDKNAEGLIWAVGRWNLEVSARPLINVHRRSLDDTWRQVIRYFGGDPDTLIGPDHSTLLANEPSEAAAQPMPAYLSSDESTTVIPSARAGDSPKGDRQAEIEHSDH